MERVFVGFILMVIGGLYTVRPDLLLKFQVWTQRTIMGAKYVPSKKTYKIVRYFGILFLILGLFVITGIFK
jgi:hypothetical protein